MPAKSTRLRSPAKVQPLSFSMTLFKTPLHLLMASFALLGGGFGCNNSVVISQIETTGTGAIAQSPAPPTGRVTVLGQFTGKDRENFGRSLLLFEEKTGIEVDYESADDFAGLLQLRVGVLNPPDVAIFAQPGLMADYARSGELVPLSDFMETTALRAAYPDTWLDLGTVDDEAYAVWYRASVKSLVWYRPSAFEAKGYDTPKSWPELVALSDRIVADGGTPWCVGLESGAATGWPGTDWIEDIMLRTAGPEAYRQWVAHEMPFNAPAVVKAFDGFGKFLRSPQYVYGGAAKTVDIPYGESALGIFNNPPDCYMHRQANFAQSFFPADKVPRVDFDVFPLPGIDERFGQPLLVAGDAMAMFNDTPESRQLMAYMASAAPHELMASLGEGFISPQKQVLPAAYPDVVSQTVAQILTDADTIHFDGSDMMPGYVGGGSFWTGMVEFAKGKSAVEVTKEIEDSWPDY